MVPLGTLSNREPINGKQRGTLEGFNGNKIRTHLRPVIGSFMLFLSATVSKLRPQQHGRFTQQLSRHNHSGPFRCRTVRTGSHLAQRSQPRQRTEPARGAAACSDTLAPGRSGLPFRGN